MVSFRYLVLSIGLLIIVSLSGCATSGETVGLVGGLVALGAQAPTTEIQQTYYLGVFDPHEQLPPQVYRVRVHGQASFLGITKFASGWLPASMVDSLGTRVSFQDNGQDVSITKGESDANVSLTSGRRLMLFGPQGFREAPANQRLVIVMGIDPSQVFTGIDTALGKVAPLKAAGPASTTQPSTRPSATDV